MVVEENENKLGQGAFLLQCNASHFVDDIYRKKHFLPWNGTALAAVYVGENHLVCEFFVLSFECNTGDMCRYDDLRCEGLGTYEGKHHFKSLIGEKSEINSILKPVEGTC